MICCIHFTKDQCFKIREFGEFFPEVCKNTDIYLQRRPDYRELLLLFIFPLYKKLNTYKTIFLIT